MGTLFGCFTDTQIGLFLILVVVVFIVCYNWPTSDDKCDQFKVVREGFVGANGRFEGFAYVRVKGGNAYKVHEDLENPELAATTIDELNNLAIKLIKHLDSKYIKDSSGLATIKPEYRSIIRKGILSLKRNFKSANMEENIPERSGGDTSYVIDKGAVFAMCLRDPKNNNQVDDKMNNLTFVLIHELGHLFTSSFGHDTVFWNNFKFLLQEAVQLGIYEPVDYKKTGSPYCGIVVTYSPLFDLSLKEYKADTLGT